MLVVLILNIMVFILGVFVSIISGIFGVFAIPVVAIGAGLGYVFGNIFLFDSFLPVTEAFYLLTAALTFKLAMFSVEVFFFFIGMAKQGKSLITGFGS
jgi:H+/Cl- antiporter ClcA